MKRLFLQTSCANSEQDYDTLYAAVELNQSEVDRIIQLSERVAKLAEESGEAHSVAYLALHDHSADWYAVEELPDDIEEALECSNGALLITKEHEPFWESLDDHLHRMECYRLCVTATGFWWSAIPKHFDAGMEHETVQVPIELLRNEGTPG